MFNPRPPSGEFRAPVHPKTESEAARIRASIRNAPVFFQSLSTQEQEIVVRAFRRHSVGPGEVVIREGDMVDQEDPGVFAEKFH